MLVVVALVLCGGCCLFLGVIRSFGRPTLSVVCVCFLLLFHLCCLCPPALGVGWCGRLVLGSISCAWLPRGSLVSVLPLPCTLISSWFVFLITRFCFYLCVGCCRLCSLLFYLKRDTYSTAWLGWSLAPVCCNSVRPTASMFLVAEHIVTRV